MAINFRLSVIAVLILIPLSLVLVILMGGRWWNGNEQLEELMIEKSNLENELLQLKNYGEWTLDYLRIRQSIDILSERKISEEKRLELTDQIWMVSRTYNFDPLLILAIVAQESHGNPLAVGRYRSGAESGAYGLMQLKIETAKRVGKRFGFDIQSKEDLMRPEVNVVLGSAYLMRLIARYGDLKYAIIAYNLGHGALDLRLKSNRPLPTRYYENVLNKYRKLVRDLDFSYKS